MVRFYSVNITLNERLVYIDDVGGYKSSRCKHLLFFLYGTLVECRVPLYPELRQLTFGWAESGLKKNPILIGSRSWRPKRVHQDGGTSNVNKNNENIT